MPFFIEFSFCPTFHNGNITVEYYKQERRLTQESTDDKAKQRTAAAMPIRKIFPTEPRMEVPNSYHYPAVRRHQSPQANLFLHSPTMQKMTTC